MLSGEGRLIGIVGFGTIGRELARMLSGFGGYRLLIFCRPGAPVPEGLPERATACSDIADLIAARPALVVEAAGAEALRALGPLCLSAGIDVVAASTGVLGDADVMARILDAARQTGARLIVPAGALGGLDYLTALRSVTDATVLYTSRKPPAAWSVELAARGVEANALDAPFTLFEGTAVEAARLYPKNLNAGLAVALAAGHGRTTVHVVADPGVTLNTHEITVESAVGSAFLRFANRPSPLNPKTSAITGHSLAAAVHRQFESLFV